MIFWECFCKAKPENQGMDRKAVIFPTVLCVLPFAASIAAPVEEVLNKMPLLEDVFKSKVRHFSSCEERFPRPAYLAADVMSYVVVVGKT